MTTPNPDTERSAVHGDPLQRLREELLLDLRAEVANQVRVVSMPPPRRDSTPPSSRLTRAVENRWTPAAVAAILTALAPVLTVWLSRDDAAAKAMQERAETQQAAISELTRKVGELRDQAAIVERMREKRERAYGHGFCALGVKSREWECDSVELLPPPHPRSKAPPIQLRTD